MYRRCPVEKMHAHSGSLIFFRFYGAVSTDLSCNGVIINLSKHIVCQQTTIKINVVISNNYRIIDLMGIIYNSGEIEKFRIQCLSFSNFAPSQKYFLKN